ncbi:MAG TPA: serine hydrolase domain-containing protein [Longimicrobium sp.]|nr:serine hydrolase domain-containing protein [Longimicrobium sp.]
MRAAALLALLLVPHLAAAQPDAAARVDSVFAAWRAPGVPGCAVGVAQNGRTVLRRAYGLAELEHQVPNTPETVFEAGSVSKQFTAAAVVLLARQGRLSLEDDIRRWIPEVPDYGLTITIRHLLNHTSGLRDWGSVMEIAGWPRGSRIHTHAHVLDIVARQRSLNFHPGAQYLYSNTGYNLLAILVERVSGTRFAEFSRREIFQPLGMTHTQWRDDFTRIVPGRAQAYTRRGGEFRLQMPFENVHGNGGLLTTVDDLLRWNQAIASGALGGILGEMETRGRLAGGRQIEYALGLRVAPYRGVREVAHSGSTAGYRAYLARYPDQSLSVAVLCNASGANPTLLAHRTADVFLGDAARDTPLPPAITVDAAELERHAGLYRSTRTGEPMSLVMAEGRLTHGGGQPLVPIAPGVFRRGESETRIEMLNATPALARVVYPDGDTVVFEAVPAWEPTPAQLAELTGEYQGHEAEATFTVAVEENRLVLRRRPDTVLPLAPAYQDAFTTPEGWLVRFSRFREGRGRALTISVERVRDLFFARIAG